MTTNEPIITIRNLFGGACFISKRKRSKNLLELCWSGDKALNILKLIRPYLILKLKQAELGIEYREYSNKYRRFGVMGTPLEVISKRREYYNQMKRLHNGGKANLVSNELE